MTKIKFVKLRIRVDETFDPDYYKESNMIDIESDGLYGSRKQYIVSGEFNEVDNFFKEAMSHIICTEILEAK